MILKQLKSGLLKLLCVSILFSLNTKAENNTLQKTVETENKKNTSKYSQIKKWAKDNSNLLIISGVTVVCICAYYFLSTKTSSLQKCPIILSDEEVTVESYNKFLEALKKRESKVNNSDYDTSLNANKSTNLTKVPVDLEAVGKDAGTKEYIELIENL